MARCGDHCFQTESFPTSVVADKLLGHKSVVVRWRRVVRWSTWVTLVDWWLSVVWSLVMVLLPLRLLAFHVPEHIALLLCEVLR